MNRPKTNEGLGASEVAAIAEASPWRTPAGVWLEKVGLSDPEPETQAMRAGRQLERPILQLTADMTDQRITHNRMSFRHPDWPTIPLWATPDGFTPHRRALVEVKMVGHRFEDWADGVPAYVNLQVQAQLACLPRVHEGLVAALIGGALRVFKVPRDETIQAWLPGLVAGWWADHVQAGRSPQPLGPDDRWALLRVAASTGARAERLATEDEATIAAELQTLLLHSDRISEQIEERRLRLAEASDGVTLLGTGWRAGWVERRTIDWKTLADEQGIPPIVIDRHARTSSAFTFRRAKREPAEPEVRVEVIGLVPGGTFR